MIIYYILAILLLVLDQWSKLAIVNNFALHEVKEVLPGILSLFYIQNEGAAWGIFEGRMFFFFIITVVVVGAMSIMHISRDSTKKSWASVTLFF